MAIDAAVFDLKAVNPSTVARFDDRSAAEIIQSIHDQGRIVTEALARFAALVSEDDASVQTARSRATVTVAQVGMTGSICVPFSSRTD
ncbi:hypothetical protein [Paenirhodobacter sp.]|uniref:hypothetical protein n=1 Tax=Paenirhodobacter sp. TaxID=1965326 RepID=UPI003B3D6ED1